MEYSGEDNLEVMNSADNYNQHLVDFVVNNLPKKCDKLLDFGSGNGFFARKITQKTKKMVLCVEPAENMHKFYKTEPFLSLSNVENASLDCIYSLNVLEHIEDDEAVVKDFYRALSKNGVLLLYLPAFPCLYSSMDKKVGHFRRYKKKDVQRLFSENYWSIEQVRYVDFLGYFASFLFKFMGNDSGTLSLTWLKIYDKFVFPLSLLLDKLTMGKILGKNIIIKCIKK